MVETQRAAVITGIGIVSCLGEGPEAHWQRLMEAAPPRADTTRFAPYIVHPLPPVDFDKQIPKKGDQRTMEPWQRIGTYAAGLALDQAGIKGRRLTGLSLIKPRVTMRGCTYVDGRDQAIIDGNIVTVTGRPYYHVWIRAFLAMLRQTNSLGQRSM